MSKIKKIMALLMTVAMVMGMSMTTIAATNSTITVKGTGIDASATVKYGQIVKENRSSTLGWQFASQDIATQFVEGWNSVGDTKLSADDVIAQMIAANMIENPANAHVEAGTINPSANLAAALEKVTGFATTVMNGVGNGNSAVFSANVSSTGKGLYIITAEREGYTYIPMAAYMDVKGTDVNVTAKGSEDQIRKKIDNNGTSVAPGERVTYTVEHEYIFHSPEVQEKTFYIEDTLTNATFEKASLVVKIEGKNEPLTVDEDYDVTWGNDNKTLKIDFTKYYKADYAGKTVTITYDAIIDKNVTSEIPVKNQATSSNGTGKLVEVKPVNFTVYKIAEKEKPTDKDVPLEGAQFQIYTASQEGVENAVKLTLADKSTVWGLAWGDPITTGGDGKATIQNLDAQNTYYVKEIVAPDGYSLNDTAYQLSGAKQKQDENTNETIGDKTYPKVIHSWTDFTQQTVTDTKLSSLPSTGGIGTTIFTIGGCVIMIAAAGLFFANRRKDNK